MGMLDGKVAIIANAAPFLASDKASFIYGHDPVIGGGVALTGLRWADGLELRASLYNEIKETVARLNT